MIKIEKASVCFMAQDLSLAKEQFAAIDLSDLEFEMVPYFSAERNAILYSSFSQMINEAIDDTDCEFMIFINPKTIATARDLNLLLEKLSSGYCFACLFGFAFFATSKQLIREIGMLDEKFAAGEYEDNDFILRMRLHGKAVWWGQDWSKYGYYKSPCPPERGSSLSFFWKKWRWTGSSAKSTDLCEKEISRRHAARREDISRSWLGWERSWGEGGVWEPMSSCDLESGWRQSSEECEMSVSWSYEKGRFYIEMLCEKEAAISFFLTTPQRIPLYMHLVYQNCYHIAPVQEDEAEMRLYLDGSIIYMNRIRAGEDGSHRFVLPASIAEKASSL